MSELEPFSPYEGESTPEQIPNIERVVEHLLKYAREHELDIEVDDLRDILGEDDNDFLGNLATVAVMYEINYEDLLVELGVRLKGPTIDAPNHLEITDGAE